MALVDDPHVEGGTAHVRGDDVLVADQVAQVARSGDPGDGAGIKRQQRRLAGPAERDGAAAALGDLEAAIYDYLLKHNARPKPFTWTKSADDILARERREALPVERERGLGYCHCQRRW